MYIHSRVFHQNKILELDVLLFTIVDHWSKYLRKFFPRFLDSGTLPPPQPEIWFRYIKKLILSYRLLSIVCTPKIIFLYSDGFPQPGGVVSRSRKILKKKNLCYLAQGTTVEESRRINSEFLFW